MNEINTQQLEIVPFVTNVLCEALPDEAEIAGERRLEHVVTSAISNKTFDQAFDTRERGAQLPVVETLQTLLLGAQIVLILVEIWRKRPGASREEFEQQAESQRDRLEIKRETLPLWSKLLGKVYDLLTKSQF